MSLLIPKFYLPDPRLFFCVVLLQLLVYKV